MALTISSPAFLNGEAIPEKYTCEGEDRSPPLEWSGVPKAARSLVLICDDPDAPGGVFRHWTVINIPTEATGLGEGEDPAALGEHVRTAVNDFGNGGYGGPCPPHGHGTHRYFFRLVAISEPALPVAADAGPDDVTALTKSFELESAELVGTYSRD